MITQFLKGPQMPLSICKSASHLGTTEILTLYLSDQLLYPVCIPIVRRSHRDAHAIRPSSCLDTESKGLGPLTMLPTLSWLAEPTWECF